MTFELPEDLKNRFLALPKDQRAINLFKCLILSGQEIIPRLEETISMMHRTAALIALCPESHVDHECITKAAEFANAALHKFMDSVPKAPNG